LELIVLPRQKCEFSPYLQGELVMQIAQVAHSPKPWPPKYYGGNRAWSSPI